MLDPLLAYKLKRGLVGAPNSMLSPEDQNDAQNAGVMNLGAALLAASGPSSTPQSLGQILGPSILQGMQGKQASEQSAFKNKLLLMQLQQDKERLAKQGIPSDVLSQQYFDKLAKEDPEAYARWLSRQNRQNTPSSLLEVDAMGKDPELLDKLQRIASAKIGAPYTEGQQAGAKGAFSRTTGGFKPSTSLPQEVAAAKDLAAGAASGKIVGEAQGGLEKKAVTAQSVLNQLDIAEPLIDISTGSGGGAAVDKAAAIFGFAPSGAQAAASLKVLQANLIQNQPRLEGPQSDKDTQLYREAAGQIGDPTVPAAIKKAAVATIRRIQKQYQDQRKDGGETAAERAKRLGL